MQLGKNGGSDAGAICNSNVGSSKALGELTRGRRCKSGVCVGEVEGRYRAGTFVEGSDIVNGWKAFHLGFNHQIDRKKSTQCWRVVKPRKEGSTSDLSAPYKIGDLTLEN